jgi:hypothetical protein
MRKILKMSIRFRAWLVANRAFLRSIGDYKKPAIGGFPGLLAADVAAVLLAAQAGHTTSCSGTLHGKGLVLRG